jgi:transposase-like protein
MSKAYRKTTRESKSEGERGQVALPLTREDIQKLLLSGVTSLALELGIAAMNGAMSNEVEELCGPRGKRRPGRHAYRYGQQRGYVSAGGQKVGIDRPRVRATDGSGEVDLATYHWFQTADSVTDDVLRRLLRGVSCRDYGRVIDGAAAGYGTSATAVSRHFVKAAGQALDAFLARRLDEARYVAVFVDGVHFKGEVLIVALGVTLEGKKRVLGLRQGHTENATLCKDLLTDLRERGLDAEQARLWVIDGAKALRKGIAEVFGDRAFVQRCQVHKARNVKSYLSDRHADDVAARLRAAYSATTYDEALKILTTTQRWLERVSPDAAKSLKDGLEETLTVLRLGVAQPLRRALASTNPLESAFDQAKTQTRRVKRWRDGDMRLRWCAAGMLRAEERFHRLTGYRHLPALLHTMTAELNQRLDNTGIAA